MALLAPTHAASAQQADKQVDASWAIPSSSTQLVVGIAEDWNESTVTLQRYRRSGATWVTVGRRFPGRLGTKGLVWGRGISPRTPEMTDKAEGDLRSPAGVFELGSAFGYDPAWAKRTKLPYVAVGSRDLMVEDPASPLYNTHVRLDHEPATPFERKQRMVLADPARRLQIYVNHNVSPEIVPGKGSAILFHIWRDGGSKTTAGCTSMADADMETLTRWLDPSRRPLYVLLPRAEYAQRADAWKLPALPAAGGPS